MRPASGKVSGMRGVQKDGSAITKRKLMIHKVPSQMQTLSQGQDGMMNDHVR